MILPGLMKCFSCRRFEISMAVGVLDKSLDLYDTDNGCGSILR